MGRKGEKLSEHIGLYGSGEQERMLWSVRTELKTYTARGRSQTKTGIRNEVMAGKS